MPATGTRVTVTRTDGDHTTHATGQYADLDDKGAFTLDGEFFSGTEELLRLYGVVQTITPAPARTTT